MSQPKLFQPIQLSRLALQHRIVLAPLTRIKAGRTDHVPSILLMKEYYAQRASTPGTLLIAEATIVAARAGGLPNAPGIWSQPQIDAWKLITDAVHAKGSFMFLQIVAMGRPADSGTLAAEDPTFSVVSASAIKLTGQPASEPTPRAMSSGEIDEYVALFAQAARNAIQAGFDGVEVHGANGYLVDQFLQDVSNTREDEYGGSVENRSRFPLRIVDAVAHAIGADRTAIRLSPWSTFQDMGMRDPLPQFTHLVAALAQAHPDLAYLHLVEPRVSGDDACTSHGHESNDALRAAWAPRRIISAGGYDRATAIEAAEQHGDLVAFGRKFIANPDLPTKLRKDSPLTPYNRATFYVPAEDPGAAHGYIDYPFAPEADERL